MTKQHDGKILLSLIGAALAFLWWPSKSFAVNVLGIDKVQRQVSYKVKADGHLVSDTFKMGDPPVLMQIVDSPYYVFVRGNSAFGQIDISVGTLASNGGFIAKKTQIVTF